VVCPSTGSRPIGTADAVAIRQGCLPSGGEDSWIQNAFSDVLSLSHCFRINRKKISDIASVEVLCVPSDFYEDWEFCENVASTLCFLCTPVNAKMALACNDKKSVTRYGRPICNRAGHCIFAL